MTEETRRLIASLKEKTSTITNEYIRLKRENVRLHEDLIKREIDYDESQIELSELKHKYNALKIAKSLPNDGDNNGLKKQINAMVREIDTCIELIEK